jgi:cyclic beta-1,2-glucan synthetase
LHGPGGTSLARQLLAAHAYWRERGLRVDLVFLLENAGGYSDELFNEVMSLVQDLGLFGLIDQPGGIFVRKGWQMTEANCVLLLAAARVVLDDRQGLLAAQAETALPPRPLPARRPIHPAIAVSHGKHGADRCTGLLYANGVGGFSPDDYEYVICTKAGHVPPAPWSNVIANSLAGFLVTDSGGGYFWVGNSQSNRLTPWSNDPVSDPPGDVIYLEDETTGGVWCPTPLPVPDGGPINVHHGQGYTIFERTLDSIVHELTVFVPPDEPVKVSVLKLTNTGRAPRRLGVAYYVEWVLGTTREATAQYVITEVDADTGAIFARNPFNADFGSHVAFVDSSLRPRTVTADRAEFIGRNGSLANPAALERVALSGRTGPGLDPCAAVRGSIALAPGEERIIIFVLGQSNDANSARHLVKKFTQDRVANISDKNISDKSELQKDKAVLSHLAVYRAEEALEAAVEQWDHICGTIRVETPDPAFDLLMNRWLVYQTLSCRVWGRSAFYQSGGAYGFRDQLQDVLALLHAAPDEARTHILRAAARQFPEGDVQHWWHPPGGNGVRTHFSDDFLWLPYAVCHYTATTGDQAIWDEVVPFIEAPPLAEGQHEVYGPAAVSNQTATIYEHCGRALNHGWKLGPHGLPLMGTGDWNDGMNMVGAGGRGESVWVAWFQIVCLNAFAKVADRRGDTKFVATCRERVRKLQNAIEQHAWDGGWYRRAYFDDGTPLGSAVNDECRIDSLTQSWAVIAGSSEPSRAEQAMTAVMRRLVRPVDRLVLLFDPPFDTGPLRPGYIKGYVPGVRENGGQYTHAAAWVVKALAMLGRGDEAFGVFSLINPILSTDTPAGVARYRGEPYVVAGDVYGRPPHVGRVGWTWYTGSSAWLYRVGLEDILGFKRVGIRLHFDPCIPSEWSEFRIRYRYGTSVYAIKVRNPASVCRGSVQVIVDGTASPSNTVYLLDDGRTHTVDVIISPETVSKDK